MVTKQQNIPSLSAYGGFVSQFIRYTRTSFTYEQFVKERQATNKQVNKKGLPTVSFEVIFSQVL